MNEELQQLLDAMNELSSTIENGQIQGNSFDQQFGWNQVHITKLDLITYVTNVYEKIKHCLTLNVNLEGINLTSHISNIQRLSNMMKGHFNSNANHLISVVPVAILTLFTLEQYLNSCFLTWDKIEDNKLLPRSIASRLRSFKVQLDNYDESFSNLDSKLKIINDAHEAAEALPTDLQSLKDAKVQLNNFLKNAQKDFDKTKNEIEQIKNKISVYASQSADALNNAKESNDKTIAQRK